jgi:GAF domain-containing protein
VVPIKVHNEVIGLLLVVRKKARPFDRAEQTLLEAIADYASISLVNARLFRALEQTAEAARLGEKRQNALLESIREAVWEELDAVKEPIELLLDQKETSPLATEQRQALQAARTALRRLARATEKTVPPLTTTAKKR